MTHVIENMTRDIFIYVSNKNNITGGNIVVPMRNRSQNSSACNKSVNGKKTIGKPRNERTSSCRNSRFITICDKPIYNKTQRKHHSNRRYTGNSNSYKPNARLANNQKTISHDRNLEPFL